jgi:hypothetical protein
MQVIKHLLITVGVLFPMFCLCGCIIPYSREYRPGWPTPSPTSDANGNIGYHSPPPKLQLVDAHSSKLIEGARIAVLIHREQYSGLCCAGKSEGAREPLLNIEPFSNLPSLVYHQRGLILLLPFISGDTAAEFMGVELWAYKPGYVPAPVDFDGRAPGSKTLVIRMYPCDPDRSRIAAENIVRRSLSDEEARNFSGPVGRRLNWLLDHP